MLHIYNTLTRKKEVFRPKESKVVKLFVCGPTVYDYIHIGNARTFIAFDIIVRFLRQQGYDVQYLQNITDIDDKIIKRATEEKKDALTLAEQFTEAYLQDLRTLGISSITDHARATAYISQITAQVETLIKKGHAYKLDNDGYYFDLSTFSAYGKLSGRTAESAEDAVSRIDETTNKRNKGDFCLWKFSRPDEPSWDSPLGKGRPGWHIEDTAITESFLGPQYDIHGGARDLLFPHHEAEIAQMESISGKEPLAKYWMHSGFLTVNGKKMAKSLGNFVTLRDFLQKHEPEALRMLVASAQYRSPLDYSEETSLHQAKVQLARFRQFIERLESLVESKDAKKMPGFHDMQKEFFAGMNDDLNTPVALAAVNTFINRINALPDKGVEKCDKGPVLDFFKTLDEIFGFELFKKLKIPANIQELVTQREEARKKENWSESDRLRDEITKLGYTINDTPKGPRIQKRSS